MGGKGSGLQRRRPPLERARDIVELNLRYLRAAGVRDGEHGTIFFDHESAKFRAEIEYDLRGKRPWLRLRHRARNKYRLGRQPVAYVIPLSRSPSNLGKGVRIWMHCPRNTSRRVTQLFLPMGSVRFASRQSLGLSYETERMTKAARLVKRAKRAHARAGGTGNWRLAPKIRPKGMRRATWERLLKKRELEVRIARNFPGRHKSALRRATRQRKRAAAATTSGSGGAT